MQRKRPSRDRGTFLFAGRTMRHGEAVLNLADARRALARLAPEPGEAPTEHETAAGACFREVRNILARVGR